MKGLKVALWVTAIGCLSAVPFIFLPWAVVESIGTWFGIESLPDMPIAVYFFKVVFGVFGLIGVFFIILARNPLKYGSMLNLGAFGLILFGLLALFLGLSIGLPPIVYIGDGLSGLVLGGIIVILSRPSKNQSKGTKKFYINQTGLYFVTGPNDIGPNWVDLDRFDLRGKVRIIAQLTIVL